MDKKEFNDITLVCKDCGEEFVWTAGEQAFIMKRDLLILPQDVQSTAPKEKLDKIIVFIKTKDKKTPEKGVLSF